MNELTPEKLRGLLPPHESKGLYVRPSHILIGYDDLLAFAAAWEEDVSDVCTINAELNTTIIRQQKRIKALERDLRWVMDFAKGQEPWDDDGNVARFNQIEAALQEAQHDGPR